MTSSGVGRLRRETRKWNGGVVPDEQMRGLRDVFASVPHDDDTTDLRRPGKLGGLGGLAAIGDRSTTIEIEASELVDTLPEQLSEPLARHTAAPGNRGELRRKTSFSLTAGLGERIAVAYTRDRWTIAELLTEALARVESKRISPTDIERNVRTLARTPASAVKSVKVPLSELDKLDALAGKLRLSRSQLMSAIVLHVLDSM